MKRILASLVAVPALLGTACGFAPKAPPEEHLTKGDYSPVVDYLEKYIPTRMRKHGFTGLSVALVDDQEVVWSEGFGFADKSAGRRSTASTVYRAGSVSKLFTAMAALKLHEEGRVDLDAPITDHVPEFDLRTRFGSIDGITLRTLLTHHSGVPGAIHEGMWAEDPDSFRTVAARLGRYYAAYPPGTVFAYSNAGYSVAGHAIENASGTPFADHLEEALLGPLEMTRSNFRFEAIGEDVARSYWKGREVEQPGLRDLPAGGLVTTVGDLAGLIRLVNADGFHGTRLLAPETVREMLAVQEYDSVYEPEGFNGIGWFSFPGFLDGKYTAVGHTGQTLAHSAAVFVVPELELGVALLANSPSLRGGLEEITREVLRVSHAVATGRTLASVPVPDRPATALPGTRTGFAGLYASRFGALEITETGTGYDVAVEGTTMKLSGDDEGGHAVSARLFGFIPLTPPGMGGLSFFAREVSGEKLIFVVGPGGRVELVATEVEAQERRAAWDAALGTYRLSDPVPSDGPFFRIDDVTLAYERGLYQLTIETSLEPRRLVLDVIDDAEATLQGYGRDLGETVFLEPDGSLRHAEWRFERTP